MDKHQKAWGEAVAVPLIAHLKKRRMDGSYAATAEQACREILAMIPRGAVVYRGGSTSIVEIGLWDQVEKLPGVTCLNPYKAGLSKEEAYEQRLKGCNADIMITSSNAITQDGILVNLDGMGNRVASMVFGPKKVILVVGINKIVRDVEAAKERIKRYAAPANARRLGYATPCAVTGLCSECNAPQRICNAWSIIEGQLFEGRIHVKLVGENLGY